MSDQPIQRTLSGLPSYVERTIVETRISCFTGNPTEVDLQLDNDILFEECTGTQEWFLRR